MSWTRIIHDDEETVSAREVRINGEHLIALVRVTLWDDEDEGQEKAQALTALVGRKPLEEEIANTVNPDPLLCAYWVFESGLFCWVSDRLFPEQEWDQAEAWGQDQIDHPEFPLNAYLDAIVDRVGFRGLDRMEGRPSSEVRPGWKDPFQERQPVDTESGKTAFGPTAPQEVRESTVETCTVRASKLDSSCWFVQFRGLRACMGCEYLLTEDCGGVPSVKITHRRFPTWFQKKA